MSHRLPRKVAKRLREALDPPAGVSRDKTARRLAQAVRAAGMPCALCDSRDVRGVDLFRPNEPWRFALPEAMTGAALGGTAVLLIPLCVDCLDADRDAVTRRIEREILTPLDTLRGGDER